MKEGKERRGDSEVERDVQKNEEGAEIEVPEEGTRE